MHALRENVYVYSIYISAPMILVFPTLELLGFIMFNSLIMRLRSCSMNSALPLSLVSEVGTAVIRT